MLYHWCYIVVNAANFHGKRRSDIDAVLQKNSQNAMDKKCDQRGCIGTCVYDQKETVAIIETMRKNACRIYVTWHIEAKWNR